MPVRRVCACKVTFAWPQGHHRHVRKCAVHKSWLEQDGGVHELGVWHGNLKLDEVVDADADDAFYKVVLYLLADGNFNHNRSVRVAAGGGWRVRRRTGATTWDWERVEDDAIVAAEVSAVVLAVLDEIMLAQVPGSGLALRACAAKRAAQRPDHVQRVMRVLRERRVGQLRTNKAITMDEEERRAASETNATALSRPRPPPTRISPPPPPPPPPKEMPPPPSEAPCMLCHRMFSDDGSLSAYDAIWAHFDKCPMHEAWSNDGRIHELGRAHATFLACIVRDPDPMRAFRKVYLSAPAFASVRMRDAREMAVRVLARDEWVWARAEEGQIPLVLACMRKIIQPLVGEVPATDEQLIDVIVQATAPRYQDTTLLLSEAQISSFSD
jgi:hypothetical protein